MIQCDICGQTIKGDMLALRAHQTTSSRCAATSSGQGLAHRVRCPHGCPRTIARDDVWALPQHEMRCEALRAREANDPPSYWRSQRSGSNQDQPSHWQGQRWEDRRDWHDNDAGYWQQEGQRWTPNNRWQRSRARSQPPARASDIILRQAMSWELERAAEALQQSQQWREAAAPWRTTSDSEQPSHWDSQRWDGDDGWQSWQPSHWQSQRWAWDDAPDDWRQSR